MDDPAAPNPYAAPQVDVEGRAPVPRSPAGLRITSGVILLLCALANLFIGLGYIAGGFMGSRADDVRKWTDERLRESDEPADQQKSAKFDEALTTLREMGTRLLVLGTLFLATVGTSITAAVFLFRGKRGGFVLFAAVFLGLAQIANRLVLGTMGALNFIELAVVALVFISGLSMLKQAAWARRATP